MSGLLGCVQLVSREEAAAAAAKGRKRDKKDKKKARKEERKARKAAKRKADEGGAPGAKRAKRGSDSDASSSSDASDDDGAAAAGVPPDARAALGMDWMSNPAHQSAPRAAPEDTKEIAAAAEAKAHEDRRAALELNPYWSADGGGMPPEQAAPSEAATAAAPARMLGEVPAAGAVGDGGASWRMKALRRAQERAKEEGRSLDSVVQERWGTLASMSAGVTREPAAHARAHLRAKAERLGPGGAAPPRREGDAAAESADGDDAADMGRIAASDRGYLRDVGREGAGGRRMMAPAAGASLSWRAGGAAAGGASGAPGAPPSRPGDWRCSGCGITCFAFRRSCHKCGAAAPGSGGGGGSDAAVLGAMAKELNTFAADGSFMAQFSAGAAAGGSAAAAQTAAAAAPAVSGAADFASGQMRGSARGLAAVAEAGVGDSREVVDLELSDVEDAAADDVSVPPPRGGAGNAGAGAALRERLMAARGGGAAAPLPQPPPPQQQQQHAPPPPAAAAPAAAGGGNMSAAAALRARLLGRAPPAATAAAAPSSEPEVIALPLVTEDGRAAPGAFGRAPAGGPVVPSAAAGDPSKRPARLQRYDAPGEKARFYADDDARSLRDLVAEARHGAAGGGGGGGNEYDANLARNVARAARFKGTELNADDEYDHDAGLDMYEKRRGRGAPPEREQQKAKQAAVADFQRANALAARCAFCFDNPNKPKQLHIAYALKSYLMLPELGRLVPGHALIVPMAHGGSARSLDEDVVEEMRNFKKCLLKMHAAAGKSVCFMETHLGGGMGHAKHCVIEAVPLPADAAASAPMYFRKAIDEAESEWSTHAAKRCIPTGGTPAGLRGAIPAHFPYFHVEFGLRDGFVHVIDEPEKWNPHFGRDVLIGLLDLPGEWTRARARRPNPVEAMRHVKEFCTAWAPFDWTKQLEG